ncbi:SUMF1/EgtB/PvdO family nonheme iron enzyme [Aliikangiella sp. IMCC44653]
MDNQQAEKLLGLSENSSIDEINSAYQTKLAMVEEKLNSAPTEALKSKFAAMKSSLEEAKSQLLADASKNSNSSHSSSSPLTQSKLYDLPGVAHEDAVKLDLKEGTMLAGRYTIEEQIGAGGMGAVFRAVDGNTQQQVAIKMMLPTLVKNKRAQERFMDEARISQQLSHPNIVNVYDVQQDGDNFFLTMELLEGQDLRSYMQNLKNTRQPYEVDDALELITKVCEALQYAHEYTVHRDIKPENIWLCSDGKIKVMDFGLARLQSASQRSASGAVLGTAYYMAPEQIKGLDNIDGRADQFAIGVMLYEMLSGDVPTGRVESLHLLNKSISKKLSQTVDKLLSNKPEQRFSDMNELITALKDKAKRGTSLPSFNFAKLGIPAVILIAILGIGGLISTGSLDNVIEALKPIDKELVAKQKAEVAKLQGEIKTYKKRLDNGQRNLKSEVRDAERNNDSNLKYLQSWQQLTDDYLFEGSSITELEGKLSMGESLLRQDSQESIKQATTTMTQVRDGYKTLWDEFNAAETLLKAEEAALRAKQTWQQRKGEYDLNDSNYVTQANTSANNAKSNQRAGELVKAKQNWQQAKSDWQSAYSNAEAQVAQIERARANEKERIAAEKKRQRIAAEKQRQRIAAEKKRQRIAAEKKRQRIAAEKKRQRIKKAVEAAKRIKMVSIPAGSFQMGCVSGQGCRSNEKPVHTVSINAFKMSETEVTFAQWDACVAAGGCSYKPDDKGSGRGNRPVIHVSYNDITQQFIPWLNKVTGNTYRLPTEAEWEYAARAGSSTQYSWGNSIRCSQARYGNNKGDCGNDRKTAPVKSFSANAFGLYDMHGNVWEWTQDCYNNTYHGAPSNGRAWTSGDCARRVLRGGSWSNYTGTLRAATRHDFDRTFRYYGSGFRLAQD